MGVKLWRAVVLSLAMVSAVASAAYAQSGSITGTVVDSQGGVLPGVDVVAKNNGTGGELRAVTNTEGNFTIPAVAAGTYTVTVSLQGFKSAVLPDIVVIAGTPVSVAVKLEVGGVNETVVVEGASALMQTQSAAVTRVINVQQIQSLPLTTRTALDFVTALPGTQTTASNSRGSTVNGLPQGALNITLDGVNVQDNANRAGDGFFMYIRPLMDSVEEINVSTSTPGAEAAGSGSVQIRMTTRSGSNRFTGSAYNTWRNQAGTSDDDVNTRNNKRGWLWRLNTPYFFNKRDRPKTPAGDYFIDDVRLQTPGFRIGGPAITDKLFYFYNHEWFLWPNQVSRTRYLPTEAAQNGIFAYTDNSGVNRTINLLALAGANGQTSTIDPIVQKLFADMRSAVTGFTGGAVSNWDLNTDKFDYSPGGEQYRHFPTVRMDYNITDNHRATGTVRYNRFESDVDILNSREPRFPGFTNQAGQWSHRYSWTGAVRSTFGQNLVNEARYGFSGGTTHFFDNVTKATFDCDTPGCTGGWFLNMLQVGGGGNAITAPASTNAPSTRYTPVTNYEDTLTWLKGQHTFAFGGSFTNYYAKNWDITQLAPTITFALTSNNDPAFNVIGNSANYPGGLNATQQGFARNLYAMLTGRVTSVGGSFVLNSEGNYQYLGERWQEMSYNEVGLFVSDSWRWKPTLTLTGGLRWQIQSPFTPDADSYTQLQDYREVYGITGEGNLFKPGTMTGVTPQLVPYTKGSKAYDTDWDNFAPSAGVVWQPRVSEGSWASKILSTEPVFRGGYSMSYEAPGFSGFTSIFASNPGASRSATRSIANGTLGTDGLPVLLRDPSRLAPAAAPIASYPFVPAINESINAFYPSTELSYTHSYSAGFQRQLGRDMAIEVQYIGNQNLGQTFEWDINGSANWNIYENGFYDEFRKAQANLRANVAAGRTPSFAYTGIPGTSPLPIFMAYFHGVPLNDARNQNPANYTSGNFSSNAWYNSLRTYNPDITGIAGTGTSGLQSPSFNANAATAGLPANFFMANPTSLTGGAFLRQNGGPTTYNSVQIELRRRLSQGLHVQASYVKGVRSTWSWNTLRQSTWHDVDSTLGPDQAIKVNWGYQLPFGRGRRFGSNASTWVEALIGGWEFDGVGRFQSGQKFNIGGFQLVGMTRDDVQDMFKFHRRADANGVERIYMFPEEVILNSIIAFSQTSATTTSGYSGALPTGKYFTRRSNENCVAYLAGDCGQPEVDIITSPWFGKTDFAFVKRFRLGGVRSIEARMDLYNVFNNINFTPIGVQTGSAVSSWEVTAAARDLNASQDAGGRITSFGLRFNW